MRTTAGIEISGAGLSGVLRMTWMQDGLAHVLEHCDVDEPSGTWTGLACPDHGLALGSDVDSVMLRRMCAHGEIADIIWEAPDDLAAEHRRVFDAAMQAFHAGKTERAERLWQDVQAAWAANYAALGPRQVRASQAAVLGHRVVRAPLRPAQPAASPRPQHRHRQPDHRTPARWSAEFFLMTDPADRPSAG